jgi:hypothetical protein
MNDEFSQETFGERVVNHFQCLRGGRPGRVSPLDLQQIGQWEAQQVPLEIIFRVMDESFKRNPQIGSLRYFTNAVADAMKRHAHAYAGANLQRAEPESASVPAAPEPPPDSPASAAPEAGLCPSVQLVFDIREFSSPLGLLSVRRTGLAIEDEARRCLLELDAVMDALQGPENLLAAYTKLEEIEDRLAAAAAASLSLPRRAEIAREQERLLAGMTYLPDAQRRQQIETNVGIAALAEFGISRMRI